MAKMRPPIIPEQPVPVLSDDQVRGLLAVCSGKDFRDRRDTAIIRLFLDTGMRLESMGGLRYRAEDDDSSDVDLRSRVVRIIAKGCPEMVLPIGTKAARDIDRYIRARAAHPRCGADEELPLRRAQIRAVPLGGVQRVQRGQPGKSGAECRAGEYGRVHGDGRRRTADADRVEGCVLSIWPQMNTDEHG